VVESSVEIKSWLANLPSPHLIRPARCVACFCAACPVGCSLQVVGHGLRERQVLGPLELGAPACFTLIQVRRFLCLLCGAVMTVVPRGVLGRRLYSLLAIVFGLALWSLASWASAQVRSAVSPWRHVAEPRQWATLKRWVDAARRSKLLLSFVRQCPADWSRRQVAQRIVASLVAAGRVPESVLRPALPDTG
jgi:hypothetical protein